MIESAVFSDVASAGSADVVLLICRFFPEQLIDRYVFHRVFSLLPAYTKKLSELFQLF
jgi:hypothetical protein